MVYASIEPFGDKRGDWQAASICSLLANLAAQQRHSKKRFTPNDFLLEFGEEKKGASGLPHWKHMQDVARNFAMLSNAIERKAQRGNRRLGK